MSLLKNGLLTAANPLVGQGKFALDKLSGGQPQAKTVDFDADTQGLLQKQQDRGNETAEDIVNRNTAGMDQKAQQFFDASQASKPQQNAALGLNPMADDLNAALGQRAQRQYQDKSTIGKSRMKLDAQDQVLKNQADAAQAVNVKTSQKLRQYSTQLKNQAAKKQARAQMLGQILGAGGSIAGSAMASSGGAAKAQSNKGGLAGDPMSLGSIA